MATTETLDDLAAPSERRVAVRVTPDALRHIRGGHPWVYDGSITKAGAGKPGDLAVVFDDKRRFAAIGLWDPDSPIRLKILHHGDARSIDSSFWLDRLTAAKAIRSELRRDPATTGFRELNGENDGFPGLVLDRYGDVGVLKLYSAAWFPHLRDIVPTARSILGLDAVVLRLSRNLRDHAPLAEGTALLGHRPPTTVEFLEGGLRFEADVFAGQKTGHFLDQRDNRLAVGRRARGARMLDVFSCTGGFAVHAAAGGASCVTLVDQAPLAIETAHRHLDANADRTAACTRHAIVGDAFAVMERLREQGEQYDLIVVDPPSFAQRQSSVNAAARSYARLTDLSIGLAAPGATIVQASCSSRITAEHFDEIVLGAADGRLEVVERTGHGIDHPVTFPQGRYLKAIVGRVR